MTITGSGNPLSMNDLNAEFGRTSGFTISFSEAFDGTFAQYGAINRNSEPGRNVYNVYTGGTDFALSWFYSYNDTETNYWQYEFNNLGYDHDIGVVVELAGYEIYNNTIPSNSNDSSGTFIDTTTSATNGNDLNLSLDFPVLGGLDILVTDPDTSATIYTVTGASMNDYKGLTNLATVYGYQRLEFLITFFN
jgi:hypothetical protein